MLINAENPFDPQPDPSGVLIEEQPRALDGLHGHSPQFGGEISWNDIQEIKKLNAMIKAANRDRAQYILGSDDLEAYLEDEDSFYFSGKLPYIQPLDPDGYPQQSYNAHSHKNQFDGGFLAGAGNHDHRGADNAGFAFAVYHPGTRIPLKTLKIED